MWFECLENGMLHMNQGKMYIRPWTAAGHINGLNGDTKRYTQFPNWRMIVISTQDALAWLTLSEKVG